MTLARLWCLLRGGHIRIPDTPPSSSWKTLVFQFHPPIVPETVTLQYEPCVRCGELLLHERRYGVVTDLDGGFKIKPFKPEISKESVT